MKKTEMQTIRARWQARKRAIEKKIRAAKPGTLKFLKLIKQSADTDGEYARDAAAYLKGRRRI